MLFKLAAALAQPARGLGEQRMQRFLARHHHH
jgi:hypothetical protein